MPARRRLERRFHLGARHLGRRHVRRGQVEAAHGVLGAGGKNRRDGERKGEQAFRQSHGEPSMRRSCDKLNAVARRSRSFDLDHFSARAARAGF
jgi:hypothetical protein